jgi:hypothetical protein
MDIAHLNHYIQYYFNSATKWLVTGAYTLVGCVIIGIIIVFGTMYILGELREFKRRQRRDY